MNATSKTDVIDKYRPPKKVEVPMTLQERREHKKHCAKCDEAHLFNIVDSPQYFCRVGDKLEILSDNPGAWRIVVICKNVAGNTAAIRWNDLNIIKDDGNK